MKSKKWIVIIIALLVVVGIGSFFLFRREAPGKLKLEVVKPKGIPMTNSVTATGTVEPVIEVEVGTQVSGIIDRLYVDYNDEVKAGQVLAEMDKVGLQAELESAQSQLATAETEYDYQTKSYNRTKQLFDQQMVSEAEYDEALYNYKRAYNALQQSKSSMVKVNRSLGYATITSPIDGVVISRSVEEGQTVAAGFETPKLYVIAKDLTQMQVVANVDEADIGQVADGQRVEFTVDAFPDDVFRGVVTQVRLEAQVASNVVTYEVVISAPNPDLKLKPGLTANVRIYTLEKEHVLSIPSKALRFMPNEEQMALLGLRCVSCKAIAADERHVWVKRGDELVETAVRLGSSDGTMSEIISGVNAEDSVVVMLNVMAMPAPSDGDQTERSPFMPTPPGGGKK